MINKKLEKSFRKIGKKERKLRFLRYLDYPLLLSFLPSNQRKRGSSRERKLLSHADESDLTVLEQLRFLLLFFSKFSKKNSNLSGPSPLEMLSKRESKVYPREEDRMSFKNFYSIHRILLISPFSFYSNR